MRRRLAAVVTTWPFVVALAMLLANDWWLKAAFPGGVTGKLSDVAGLYLVGLLLLAAWPGRRRGVLLGLAAAFAWWKSPLSEPAIRLLDDVGVAVGRTVDYGDLVALVVVVACAPVVAAPARYGLPRLADRRAVLTPLIALTTFAILGTSVATTRQHYLVRPTASAPEPSSEALAGVIATVAAEHGLACVECAAPTAGATYERNGLRLSYTVSGGAAVFDVAAVSDAPIFGTSGREKAEALRAALKTALARRFRGLEYVEALDLPARHR
jgi:hypothetical protein